MSLRQKFTMHVGDTYKMDITINDLSGNPVNITGAGIEFALSMSANGDPLLIKSIDNGVVITDGPNGVLRVTLSQADTKNLAPQTYFHETKLIVGGERDTVLTGSMKIMESILK